MNNLIKEASQPWKRESLLIMSWQNKLKPENILGKEMFPTKKITNTLKNWKLCFLNIQTPYTVVVHNYW